jgi:hypothetical protein
MARGATVKLLGVGDGQGAMSSFAGVNDQLRAIAEATGATFVPLPDGTHVHPDDYKGLAAAALAASSASKPSNWSDVNPNWFGKPASDAPGESADPDVTNSYGRLVPRGALTSPSKMRFPLDWNYPFEAPALSGDSNTTINNVSHKVDISIEGVEDPSIAAHMVALNQSRAALDLTRNLQGATE